MEHQTSDSVAQTRETVKILKGLSKERIQFMEGGSCYCFIFTSYPPTQTHIHKHQNQKKFLKWDSQTKMFNVHNT